jgi:hypothetical protein
MKDHATDINALAYISKQDAVFKICRKNLEISGLVSKERAEMLVTLRRYLKRAMKEGKMRP